MDVIERQLNEFIDEVKTFEHSYPKDIKPWGELLLNWGDAFRFCEVLIDILGFIEDNNILLDEYKKRITFLTTVTTNKDFISYHNNLNRRIKEAWALLDTVELKQEQEKYFLKCSWAETKEEYYPKEIKQILRYKSISYDVNNIDLFIKAVTDENNYFQIYAKGYVKTQIDSFITQYEDIPLPSVLRDNQKFKQIKKDYESSSAILVNMLAKSIKIKAHEFVLFDDVSTSYRLSKLTSARNGFSVELDCAMQTVESVELVYSVLQLLKALKYHIRSNQSKNSPNDSFNDLTKMKEETQEEYILFYNDAKNEITINNNTYCLTQALYETFEFFINGENKSFETKEIAKQKSISPQAINQRIKRLKETIPELEKYINNDRVGKAVGKYSLTIPCQTKCK